MTNDQHGESCLSTSVRLALNVDHREHLAWVRSDATFHHGVYANNTSGNITDNCPTTTASNPVLPVRAEPELRTTWLLGADGRCHVLVQQRPQHRVPQHLRVEPVGFQCYQDAGGDTADHTWFFNIATPHSGSCHTQGGGDGSGDLPSSMPRITTTTSSQPPGFGVRTESVDP